MPATKTKTRKVYDFKLPRVQNQLVRVLKRRKNASSIADLIADTGLPKYQVEETMKVISNEYRGHLKVTESGEILYYFPGGMHNQVKGFMPAFKKGIRAFLRGLGKVLAFLFKIWIMVMLIGYFVLFLLILIASIVAAIAASAANKNRNSRDKGGFYLVIKVFELFTRIWFYGSLAKSSSYSSAPKKRGRPLHKSVFAYVFGEPDPHRDWNEQQKKKVIAYLQGNKGVLTLEELITLTGLESGAAQQWLNRFLLEFEGSPEVTERGTLVYLFPELLRTTGTAGRFSLESPEKKTLVPFNNNEKKVNGWLSFFNVFNFIFGAYFTGHVLLAPIFHAPAKFPVDFSFIYKFLFSFLEGTVADPNLLILVGLGTVPLAFSFFFFLIPLLRNIRRSRENNLIKEDNLRQKIFGYFFQNPLRATPGDISIREEAETPKNATRFRQKVFDDFAAAKHADIDADEKGRHLYNFTEFKDELVDLARFREQINLQDYAVGKTVFDSGA